jgi:glutathione peroxidase
MIKLALIFAFVNILTTSTLAESAESAAPEQEPESVLDFTMPLIDGTPTPLSNFKAKVILIVNVASKCGFTGQYDGLQKLYEKYKDDGFTVLGFPANNFLGQEPGTNNEIANFCRTNYGVTFPMFSKISVKGDDKHPLYQFLTEKKTNPEFSGEISWNFNKFIIDKNGEVCARFGSMTSPSSKKLVKAIEAALSKD